MTKRILGLWFICLFIPMVGLGQTVHELARTGTVESMKALLDKDSSAINRLSERGMTPFILACYRGNNEVAKYLANRGADLTYCTSEGSAIYGMIFKNNTEMLDFILEKGVSPNDTCQFSQWGTPLHMAMSLKRYALVTSLLKHHASLSVLDPQGKSIQELLLIYKDEELNAIFKEYETN